MKCLAAHLPPCTQGKTSEKLIRGYCSRHYELCWAGKLPGMKLLPRNGSLRRRSEWPSTLRRVSKQGYAYVRKDDESPFISEHRMIMEQKLGRKLRKGESVHHINGHRDDNHPDNLELWVVAPRPGVRARQARCSRCGAIWGGK